MSFFYRSRFSDCGFFWVVEVAMLSAECRPYLVGYEHLFCSHTKMHAFHTYRTCTLRICMQSLNIAHVFVTGLCCLHKGSMEQASGG